MKPHPDPALTSTAGPASHGARDKLAIPAESVDIAANDEQLDGLRLRTPGALILRGIRSEYATEADVGR
jgi:hypothetical protein